MPRSARWAGAALLLSLLPFVEAQDRKYSIKTAQTPLPKEIAAPIQKLIAPESVQLIGLDGKSICEVWFRKEIPAEATPDQVKMGLTYREIKQTEVIGVIRFNQDWRDYRKQKVKAGAYTLRLGYQPQDGDHMGASDYQDFLVVLDAANHTSADLMDPKHMTETSAKSIATGHPGVFMLFPTKPGASPALAAMPKDHWVLQSKEDAVIGGKKDGALGIGVTLVGAAE